MPENRLQQINSLLMRPATLNSSTVLTDLNPTETAAPNEARMRAKVDGGAIGSQMLLPLLFQNPYWINNQDATQHFYQTSLLSFEQTLRRKINIE